MDEDFNCIYCKGILKHPVRKIKDVGNLCESCFDRTAYARSEKRMELETVMVNLLLPCKYSYRGCCEKGTFLIMFQHEQKCNYRDMICPLFELQKCDGTSHVTDFIEHFSSCHSSQVLISENNSLNIAYKIDDGAFSHFWIMAFKDANVLLNVRLEDENLEFLMYYLGDAEDTKKLTCKIQHQNGDICTHERSCTVLHTKDLRNVESETANMVSFSREILESYFGQNLNTIVTLETDVLNVNNDDILSRIECPVCSNFMRTNIMLCTAGHSVCNECESKLEKCPICGLPFYGARNFALEGVGDALKIIIKGEDVECPLRKELQCLWKGIEHDILEHVKDNHKDKIILNKNFDRVMEYTPEFREVNYFMTYGQVFKITCKKDEYDDDMVIIVELIGHDEDIQKYTYNISFNSLYKQNSIWYTKSKVVTRRRIEYHIDYLAIGRMLCDNQLSMSYSIVKNRRY